MPVSPGLEDSEAPARWKQFKETVCRVRGVFHDVPGPLPSYGAVLALYRVQRGSNNLFCSPYSTLQSRSVLLGCSSKPNSDGGAQDGLDDCSVELKQQLLGQTMFPQEPKKVHLPLGLFEDGADVLFPLQVLRDDCAQESEVLHSGHRAAEDCEGGQSGGMSPKIN